MFHIRHDNHDLILLPEAVLHTDHILSPPAKIKGVKSVLKQRVIKTHKIKGQVKCKQNLEIEMNKPSNSETLELGGNASWMAGRDEMLEGKHLSATIWHLSLTKVDGAECPWCASYKDTSATAQIKVIIALKPSKL